MSVTVPVKPGGKGGRLTGGALTTETLGSSSAVLRRSGHRAAKGLQQHYTPAEAAELVGAVLRAPDCNVLDLTAGDGALLNAWPADRRYGVEIDADQVGVGDYLAIHGDVQHIYPLLRLARLTFGAVALNPPFGLDWTDSKGKTVNSTLQTLRYGLGMLADDGRGVLIAGRDRYARDIASRPEARGLFAVIEVSDLFDGVALPCVLAFFVQPHKHTSTTAPAWRAATRGELPDLEPWVDSERVARCEYLPSRQTWLTPPDFSREWETIALEHARRRNTNQKTASHDLTLVHRKLRVSLSPFAQLALARDGSLDNVRRLHGQSVSYFAYNARDWKRIEVAADAGALTVSPALLERVDAVIDQARKQLVPNYPIRPQQRLGYLDDLDSIVCKQDDPDKGYLAGERYPLRVDSKVKIDTGERLHTTRSGDQEVRRYKHERKLLQIEIGPHSFDEEPSEIGYILEHFDVPDPGDLASLYPREVEAMRQLLAGIARDYGLHGLQGPVAAGRIRWNFRDFQVEDLARLLVKRSGLLSWEQGLGKTLGMMALAVALERLGAQRAALFVVPQDLIPQWTDEAQAFFGRSFTIIESPAHARRIADHVRRGGQGWFIAHMEGLSISGKRDDSLNLPSWSRSRKDEQPRLVVHPSEYARLTPGQRARAIKHTGLSVGRDDGPTPLLTTEDVCPSCLAVGGTADASDGPRRWDGRRCLDCGYVHKRLKVKTAGHWLSTAFRRGAIFVDEITNASGDSLRSDAVCGLQSDHKFGGTGTPIKNYVNDAFKLLWWCLGNASERFPYDFHGGRGKFERDFCVIEYLYGAKREDAHKIKARKVLPRVTNLSMLWRLLCGGMIRRRKEDTGEPLVPCTIHPIWVPAGQAQAEMNKQWTRSFKQMFAERHPDHPLVQAGVVERFEAALGLLWKMEYASTLPAADPDLPWLLEHADDTAREKLQTLSNWTPANLKALELALAHARDGEKVVLFSDLIETGRWFCDQLQARGVNAAHIVEERDGKAATKAPRKRAAAMREFRFGDTQVLCVGIKAVKQGHNLDTASVAIFAGQEWSHEAKAQAMARVHRLSSKKPVNIYVPMPTGAFIAGKKHELLNAKSASSDLALDGQLIEQDEQEITWQQVIEQMKRQGIGTTGDELSETEIEAIWRRAEGPFAPLLRPAALAPVVNLSDRLPLEHRDELVDVVETDFGQFALAI